MLCMLRYSFFVDTPVSGVYPWAMIEITIMVVSLGMGFGMGLVAAKPIAARRAPFRFRNNGEDYSVVCVSRKEPK